MTIYRGMFGNLYAVNQNGIICVSSNGCDWQPSLYSTEGFRGPGLRQVT